MRKKVYVDVTNTIMVDFITGIQKVVKQFLKEVDIRPSENLEYIPIYYCKWRRNWYHISLRQKTRLIDNFSPTKPTIRNRVKGMVRRNLLYLFIRNRVIYEKGSLFFDLESSWHNPINRTEFFKKLGKNDIETALFVHDIIPITHPYLIKEDTVKKHRAFLNIHLNSSKLFVCNSKTTAKNLTGYLKEMGINQRIVKSSLLASEIGMTFFQEPLVKGKYILSVGTLEIRKNYDLFISAFDKIREHQEDIKFVIVGKMGWKVDDTIDRLKNHPEFGKRILWMQNVSEVELSNLYQNSYLYVAASVIEGFGLPIVEALTYGIPVICSDTEIFREVGQNYPQYFDLEETDALSNAIESFLADPSYYLNEKKKLTQYKPRAWAEFAEDVHEILNDYMKI